MHLAANEFSKICSDPAATEELSPFNRVNYVFVEVNGNLSNPAHIPCCPIIAVSNNENSLPYFDTVVTSDKVENLSSAIDCNPIASSMFVQLLRHNEKSSIENAIYAESLTYSTLQNSSEFESWLQNRKEPQPVPATSSTTVLVERIAERLEITLNRPEKHNAWSTQMKDEFCEALQLATVDTSIKTITLKGKGPSFCSGGDLNEFGMARDAGKAHISRILKHAGNYVNQITGRITAFVHGACIGAGIEVPAFASRIVAETNSVFQLPEVGMGLVPGAGGTASVLRRIGKHKTAWLGLTGARIDAPTALKWGLVDAVKV